MSLKDAAWLLEVGRASEFLSLIDGDDRLLYVNHPQPGVGGYEGKLVWDFIAPAYHDIARRSIEQARESGLPQVYESEALGPHGDRSFYSNWVFGLPYEGDSEVVAFIATDITAQRRAEVALERSETTLRSLVDNAPDHIMILDRERRMLYINRFELGFPPEDIIGKPVETFVPVEHRDRVIDAITSVLETGAHEEYETVVHSAAGEANYFSTRLGPIILDGKVERVTLISRNITERRAAEEEHERLSAQLQHVQKMEALGQLTGGVAHDFNNLLTAISGNLELLKHELQTDDEAATYIAESLQAVERAADLTRRLLVFSRKQQLRPAVENINELVDGMLAILHRTLGETIEVETLQDPDLWHCEVDPGELEQAILNLAVNARDAMPSGGRLEITTRNVTLPPGHREAPQLPAGPYVSLAMRDSGEGMTAAVASQAFEPFYTTKEPGKGTGLGLSMVYGFVSQSGGHVSLDTGPGEGTLVKILLPRTQRPTERRSEERPMARTTRGDGEVVLVVEDQSQVQKLSVRMVEKLGYRTRVAGDGAEALEQLARHPDVALLFSDIGLPGGINGFELADRARRLRPTLPVLFTSGYPEVEAGSAERLPDAQLLEKPFRRRDLAFALTRALGKSPDDERTTTDE